MKQSTVAIVTGASQGIGRATAIRLAQAFSTVVLVARNQDALKETEMVSPNTEDRIGDWAVIHSSRICGPAAGYSAASRVSQ